MGAVRRYMVVVVMPDQDPEARLTGKIDRQTHATREAQARIAEHLSASGVVSDAYVFDAPSVMGTFAAHTTEAVAKIIRKAPGVQAVLEA